jgi:hypothetical protein
MGEDDDSDIDMSKVPIQPDFHNLPAEQQEQYMTIMKQRMIQHRQLQRMAKVNKERKKERKKE